MGKNEISRDEKFILKMALGTEVHPREELNYACYDGDMLMASDTRIFVTISNMELGIPSNSYIAMREMREKILTVNLDNKYEIPLVLLENLEPLNIYDNIHDYIRDNRFNFPIYNINLLKILQKLDNKNTEYIIYERIYCVKSGNISVYFMPSCSDTK